MPINPSHYGSFTFKDYSRELSSMSFHFDAVTAVSIAGFLTAYGAFRTATQALSLGALVADSWTGDRTKYSAVPPSDVNAQRERKFQFTYEDDTTLTPYQIEIPVAEFTGRLIADTDLVDLTETDVAAWITAFEALCQSPENNEITVIEGRAVGRNL